jgi:hypothetical protein
MREQWEMCVIHTRYTHSPNNLFRVQFYSPQKSANNEYPIKELDDYICNLLADGWEPYSATIKKESIPVYYFRRCVSGFIEVNPLKP